MLFPGFRDQGDTALIPDSVVVTMISSSIKCQTEMRSIFKTNNLLVKKHTFEPPTQICKCCIICHSVWKQHMLSIQPLQRTVSAITLVK